MDWKYKHFDQEAIFKAPPESVAEAARAVVTASPGKIEDTSDGFVAQGSGWWNTQTATFHIMPDPAGTKVAVELLVERASMRGYMLVDIGGYYNGQIDKWFTGISRRLEGNPDQILVSKTTSNNTVQRGCLFGCLVYLVVGACLGTLAIALDHALFPNISASIPGPLTVAASILGLIAGLLAYLYVARPDAATSRFLRERLQGIQNKEKK